MSVPCKDCPDREVGCHGRCEKYKAYDLDRQRIRTARQMEHENVCVRIAGAIRIKNEIYRKQKGR